MAWKVRVRLDRPLATQAMHSTDAEIATVCRKHGATMVSDAAYEAMLGRRKTLDAMGLADLQGLEALHRVTVIADRLMRDKGQAADSSAPVGGSTRIPQAPQTVGG
jgi:hypothetical protein